MIDQQEGTEGERPGMAWALRSLCRPSARAHLLTTGQGPAVVLPDGSRALSGGRLRRGALPAGIYQQTPTAACASNVAAPMHWGAWGPLAANKLRPGIYRCSACYHCYRPSMCTS